MKEYKRQYSQFSLCGLNCGLCPRYHTDGSSKCPGCGGPDFHLKHPSCAVITCNSKHDNVEYCFQCSAYPCEKYTKTSTQDSFITYRHVVADFEKARRGGIKAYQKELDEKAAILESLIANYNDGKRKGFYCNAVNLLELSDIRKVMAHIAGKIARLDIGLKEKIKLIVELFESKAKEKNIELRLRK
jgi:translation initiation factor IF-1